MDSLLLFSDCLLGLVAEYVEIHEAYALSAPTASLTARCKAVQAEASEYTCELDKLFAHIYLRDFICRRLLHQNLGERWTTVPRGLRLLILELSTRERYGQPRHRGQPAAPKQRSWKFVQLEVSLFGVHLFVELRRRLDLTDDEFGQRFVTERMLSGFCVSAAHENVSLVHSLVSSHGEDALKWSLQEMSYDLRLFDKWFNVFPRIFMDMCLWELTYSRNTFVLNSICRMLAPRLKDHDFLPMRDECHVRLLWRMEVEKDEMYARELVELLREKCGLRACGSCLTCRSGLVL
jgi:hypothetical protein